MVRGVTPIASAHLQRSRQAPAGLRHTEVKRVHGEIVLNRSCPVLSRPQVPDVLSLSASHDSVASWQPLPLDLP